MSASSFLYCHGPLGPFHGTIFIWRRGKQNVVRDAGLPEDAFVLCFLPGSISQATGMFNNSSDTTCIYVPVVSHDLPTSCLNIINSLLRVPIHCILGRKRRSNSTNIDCLCSL